MRLIGATIIHGNQCFTFENVNQCLSLLDKKVSFEYAGITVNIQPGEKFLATLDFCAWALRDKNSPFFGGRLAVSDNDEPMDLESEKKKIVKEEARPVVELKDGLPDETWRPAMLMRLYKELNEPLESHIFAAIPPLNKAKQLRKYMEKNGYTIKDNKLVKEIAT